ncbi:MAG: c-type cytochrome domain-containing protein [Candidatus Competibacteraceae bacterium]|nr:c-type cytochrome domain-containing protein [Candidatus Competibacteraceae bacterium]
MNLRTLLVFALILGLGALMGCSPESPEKPVSFQNDVFPILKASCLECHVAPNSDGYEASGLALSTYEELMKGTHHGPVVIAGQSLNSSLNRLIEGRPGVDPSIQMPHGKVKLSEEQLLIVRNWVDQGAENN